MSLDRFQPSDTLDTVDPVAANPVGALGAVVSGAGALTPRLKLLIASNTSGWLSSGSFCQSQLNVRYPARLVNDGSFNRSSICVSSAAVGQRHSVPSLNACNATKYGCPNDCATCKT